MLIADILRSKGSAVFTVTPDETVEHLLAILAERGIGAVIVSSDGVRLDGMVSERDVVRALASNGPSALSMTVAQICTAAVITITPGDRLELLMQLMTDGHVRHVPVIVDAQIGGIVSIGDAVKARISELESERQALSGYINSGG